MTYLSDIQQIGIFILESIQQIAQTVFSTILVWIFILFILKLCVKTFKKIIG